jgi:hypothetical protein
LPATEQLAAAMYHAVGEAYGPDLTYWVQPIPVRKKWLKWAVEWLATQSPTEHDDASLTRAVRRQAARELEP